MIEIKNLTKQYGKILAVDNISFTVEKGEVVGFLGPNGAGKSTTMNIITGFIPSTSGEVKVCGYDIMDEPLEVKKRIGFLPEHPPLYFDMTVTDYLKFVAELKHVGKDRAIKQITDIMELVKITDVKKRLVKNLSKGYKQRVGLAQALIGNPEVLIMDEPTVGLDPKQIIEIRKLIKELGKQHTIILSSHILPEVSAVCEKIIIINKGKIAAIDVPEKLSKTVSGSDRLTVTVSGPKNNVHELLKAIEGVKYVEAGADKGDDGTSFIVESHPDIDIRKQMFNVLAKAGYPIMELKTMDLSLEDVFLQVTTTEKEAK